MTLEQDTLRRIVEAAIMAAETPISVRQIMGLFPDDAGPDREQIMGVLDLLARECEDRGVVLKKIGDGWRYQTREDLAPWLRKMNEGRPPRYSRALLETLAIIAYRQPVTRGDIEDIRGVAVSSEIMRTLQEREWIRQVGVRDVPGHPGLYGTTAAFLAYFNLESLKELPELIEQRDLETIAREQNLELPAEVSPEPIDGDDDESMSADDEESDHATEVAIASDDTAETPSGQDEQVDGPSDEADSSVRDGTTGNRA